MGHGKNQSNLCLDIPHTLTNRIIKTVNYKIYKILNKTDIIRATTFASG
jgi:hypothetical protein